MQATQQILERAGNVLIGNYARLPVVMDRGEGVYLWDTDGRRYIDLFAGFGGSILGHAHPDLVQAATRQAQRLWHVGNTFHTQPQIELAERLNRCAFDGQAFFCHSGLEANEAAVKLARLRGQAMSPKRWKVVSFHRSFHGRSLAMIAATGNPAVRVGFEPGVPGFTQVDLGDLEGLSSAIDPETAAVIVEPIQGEGGIWPVPVQFMLEMRRICDQQQITLIFDEVWTGCGRTGKWFGHQHLTDAMGRVIEPDIMTLGKAAGGGLPVGVMLAKRPLAALLTPGKHGCTLGGNPICMAAGAAVFEVIERQGLLGHATKLGERAMTMLRGDSRIRGKLAEVRGRGLFIGIDLKAEPQKLVEKALELGVVVNLTSKKVVRLAPPLTISAEQWEKGLDLVCQAIAAC
jgi:acetylornithine/N-succinyldiaminopimelate aminotransferase